MGWSIGHDSNHGGREIGYGVVAFCDHPGCGAEIDRGLGHVCGAEPYGGEKGCGLYFCGEHQSGGDQLCERCAANVEWLDNGDYTFYPFQPTFDHPRWIAHKLTDPSWAQWREDQGDVVIARLREKVGTTLLCLLTEPASLS